jgi:hypothetical protein
VRLILLAALLAALVVGPASGAQAERTGPTAAATLKRATCPRGLSGCRSAIGRVVLVESVDPDGDGDLHVVLAAGDVTLPGLTSVDVAPALRPARDPRVGDEVSAAGPVQRGSIGQSQIHALELHVRRARH